MEYTQEELQEFIEGIEPEVVEQESVYAGHRPVVQLYSLPDGTVVRQQIEYFYEADSAAWGAVKDSILTILKAQ